MSIKTHKYKVIPFLETEVKTYLQYIITKGNDQVSKDAKFTMNFSIHETEWTLAERYILTIINNSKDIDKEIKINGEPEELPEIKDYQSYLKKIGLNIMETEELSELEEYLEGCEWVIDTEHGEKMISHHQQTIEQIKKEYGLN